MKKTSYPKQDIRVLLLEGVSRSAIEAFQAAGYSQIEFHEKSLPEAELRQRIGEAHLLGIRSRTQLTAEVLDQAKRLIAIGCFCIGTNQVDLGAAKAAGIPVFNAPYSNTRSVAELVIAEAILLMRRIPQKNAECHRGGWSKSAAGSHEARGKTLGIVGYGKIGTQTGLLAEAIGMRVIFHDLEPRLPLGNARPAGSLQALLQDADVVTLHVPQTERTRHLIDTAALARMKAGAVLVNLARGHAVDIDALCAALRSGHLRGAAIDVFPVEPACGAESFESPLRALDNVILTPHVGGSTVEAQCNLGIEVSEKLRDYLTLGAVRGSVNLPEVSVGAPRAPSRLVHVHHDQPGVMSRLNGVLAAAGLNVSQLHLETDGGFGVAVVDLSRPLQDAQLAAVSGIEGTVRAFTTLLPAA